MGLALTPVLHTVFSSLESSAEVPPINSDFGAFARHCPFLSFCFDKAYTHFRATADSAYDRGAAVRPQTAYIHGLPSAPLLQLAAHRCSFFFLNNTTHKSSIDLEVHLFTPSNVVFQYHGFPACRDHRQSTRHGRIHLGRNSQLLLQTARRSCRARRGDRFYRDRQGLKSYQKPVFSSILIKTFS